MAEAPMAIHLQQTDCTIFDQYTYHVIVGDGCNMEGAYPVKPVPWQVRGTGQIDRALR
jgi:hypothetical protein